MLRTFTAFLLVTITAPFLAAQSPTTTAPATEDPCVETKAQVTRLENRLNDWPALGRYHDANAKLAAPARNEERVIFMGDSITDSWDDPRYGGFFPANPTSTAASAGRQLRRC